MHNRMRQDMHTLIVLPMQKQESAEVAAQAGEQKPTVVGSKDDLFGTEQQKGRKQTEEGYAIYTEDELGLGRKAGGTPLCPFDCECCF